MAFAQKIATAKQVFQEHGLAGFFGLLRSRWGLPIPQTVRSRWVEGIGSELTFWDEYFRTKGLQWPDDYQSRLDPDLPLQPRVAALLPQKTNVHILDVGAGPLTCLGKKLDARRLRITAVDPLADEYDALIAKHHVQPLIRTQKLAAERLSERFSPDSFDLVHARNCIDHSYDPEEGILQMVKVARQGCHVLLEHFANEAETENYGGFHQWNFAANERGDFMISSRRTVINMTQKYARVLQTTCELVPGDGGRDLLITRIQKK